MSSKGKILVVDDDRLVLATLTHGLAQAGYEIVDADNGDDAILLAREHRPDLALLDIRMEGMSGFDVAAYLRESLQTPFMFLSAFSDDATAAQVQALGAVAYLVKPLDIAQITPTVDAALARVRAERARGAATPVDPSPAPAPAPPAPVSPPATAPADLSFDPVPVAVGILMHRYSLDRLASLDRLRRLAEQDGRDLRTQAEQLVSALELLSRPGTV